MHARAARVAVFSVLMMTLLAVGSDLAGQSTESWPPDAPQHKLYVVGNAHIDIPWLWPWPEAMAVGLSTFRSALDRMKEYPDFEFTASSAILYEWAAAADPGMMAEIRQRVAEGRWGIMGGWMVEPDVNIPNGESLLRQGLYGQRIFQQLTGRRVEIAANPDSFGHTGSLPQIIKLQGMHGYVFMRPGAHEKQLPADVFWWQGADGTRIPAYRIPASYGVTADIDKVMQHYLSLQEPTNSMMFFYGAGDHGGGPAKQNIQTILDISKQPGAPKIIFSTVEQYFDELGVGARHGVPAQSPYPVVTGDLQHHSVGCYTAESQIKKDNRSTEAALVTGEKMAALASVLVGFPYPKAAFADSWRKVLLMQFHDSMAGTALPQHYVVSHDAYGYAQEVANQAMYRAVEKIAWQIPATDPASSYLVVFNPHAWPAKLNVQYDFNWQQAPEGQINSRVEDENGDAIAHQWTAGQTVVGDRAGLVFQAPVPAFGYRQFRISKIEATAAPESAVHATEKTLENEHLRATFGDDGTLSLYDKDAAAEVFKGGATGARGVVINDPSDTWSHDVVAYTDEIGQFGAGSFRVMENGPVRAMLRVRTQYGNSSMRTDWLLYAGARSLEARVSLDWHEHRKILKFSFPVDVQNPVPTYEIADGFIVRQANGHEDPGQRWVDVSGERNGSTYGLTVLNDAKYGYSVQDNDLRVSIVRGAPYAQHQPRRVEPNGEYIWEDQGIQTFRMVLAPHSGTWQDAGIARMAEEFTAPVPLMYQGIHRGTRAPSGSFLSVDAPDIVVSAVKQAEDGSDLIIRCYETAGHATQATLDLGLLHRKWTGRFHPLEIKTLRVPVTPGGAIREVNALEE